MKKLTIWQTMASHHKYIWIFICSWFFPFVKSFFTAFLLKIKQLMEYHKDVNGMYPKYVRLMNGVLTDCKQTSHIIEYFSIY